MKKLLTVLLVIAVICTFSFGSAFAKTGENSVSANLVLMQEGDYYFYGYLDDGQVAGTAGITEAEKAAYVDLLEDMLDSLDDDQTAVVYASQAQYHAGYATTSDLTKLYAGEQLADATALVTKTLESVKAVKTSSDLNRLMVKFWNEFNDIKSVATLGAASFTSVLYLADNGTYLLPGYGYFNKSDLDGNTFTFAAHGAEYGGVFATKTNALYTWMVDNGFTTTAKMNSAAAKAKLEAALVNISSAETNTVYDYTSATPESIVQYYVAKSLEKQVSEAVITDFDAVYALNEKVDDFITVYGDDYTRVATEGNKTLGKLMKDVYDAALSYVKAGFNAEVKPLLLLKPAEYEAKKADIFAFAEKVLAFDEKYETELYDEYYLSDAFTAFEKSAHEAVEDAAFALNVERAQDIKLADKAAFEAYTAASDAYLAEVTKDAYNLTMDSTAYEAFVLAAKANLAYLEGKVDNTALKAQQVLNNATVKVTTQALGNKKISVKAKVDAESFGQLIGNGNTVEYKFYQKKAANSTYKFTKTKTVNYITYTGKTLKKGTKYNFRVGVVVKNAKGEVVAEKSYKASGLGIRVCK